MLSNVAGWFARAQPVPLVVPSLGVRSVVWVHRPLLQTLSDAMNMTKFGWAVAQLVTIFPEYALPGEAPAKQFSESITVVELPSTIELSCWRLSQAVRPPIVPRKNIPVFLGTSRGAQSRVLPVAPPVWLPIQP